MLEKYKDRFFTDLVMNYVESAGFCEHLLPPVTNIKTFNEDEENFC
jgi:hypothetical protein